MNRLIFRTSKPITGIATLAVVLLVSSLSAPAQTAGYDLFQTASGASVDLSSIGVGVVPLTGVPIQTTTGNTDTIMHRTADMPTGGGTVPVTVFALMMKSANPVTFQGQSADVYLTVNNSAGAISTSVVPQPDSLSASTGTLTVRTDGTFDSSITVNADVIIVPAGGSPSGTSLGHQPASAITLTSANSTWSSTAPSGYPSVSSMPSGGFYPKPVHNGRHPIVPSSCGTTSTTPAQPSANAAKEGTAQQNAATGEFLVKQCLSNTHLTTN